MLPKFQFLLLNLKTFSNFHGFTGARNDRFFTSHGARIVVLELKIPWRRGRESATIAESIEHSLYQEIFRYVLKVNVFMKRNARIPRKWQYFPNRSGVGKMSFTNIIRIFASNNY